MPRWRDFERASGARAQARERLLRAGRAQARRGAVATHPGGSLNRIAEEERARELEDWPEPRPSASRCGRAWREGKGSCGRAMPVAALAAADALCASQPAWRAAHWLRARALDAVGRVDEEARELRALTQLSPSHAAAWRRLGEILAAEGGLLEADRADEALRQALSLEPSWSELWLLRARVALRQGRAQDAMRALDRYSRAGGTSGEAARLSRRGPRAGGPGRTGAAGHRVRRARAVRRRPGAAPGGRGRAAGARPRAPRRGDSGLAGVRGGGRGAVCALGHRSRRHPRGAAR